MSGRSDPVSAAAGVARPILWGVALVALCTLSYEVMLTRIFSVTLWYHFGFLAISLALLGTAAAGVFCYAFPDFLIGDRHPVNLCISAIAFGIGAPLAVTLHVTTRLPEIESGLPFYLAFGAQLTLLFVTFFFAGLCISIALFRYAREIGTVYFFDLTGAALGSALVVPLLYRWSPLALVFAVAAGGFVAACLFARAAGARPASQAGLLGAALVMVGLWLGNDALGLLHVGAIKSYREGYLQRDEPAKIFEKWSPISRVAVFAPPDGAEIESVPGLWVSNDAGAATFLIRFDGDYSALGELQDDALLAAYWLKKNAKVLVVGAGGGRDVLAGLSYEPERITAIDVNPVMKELTTERYADYIGRIFDDPRTSYRVHEGRNFVAASGERYDIILFTMIDSWSGAAAGGAYVFNENSLYTIEAVRDYMNHLEPDGILSMSRYYRWAEGLRLTNMFIEHLADSGITDPSGRIVVLRKEHPRPVVTVLLKNGEFTRDEVDTIAARTLRGGASVLYAPYLAPSDFAEPRISSPYRALIQPERYGETRASLVSSHPRNLEPSTDDRPFFFFTTRPLDVFRMDRRDHAARKLALPLLYGMAIVFGAIGLLTVFLPLVLRSREGLRSAPLRTRSLVYFAMLGTGFMLVEISLIQRLTIFLGHPTWSFVVVLSAILLSGGLGSLYSARWSRGNPEVLAAAIGGVVALLLLCALVFYNRFIDLMWLPMPVRIVLAVATIAPPGFLMGMCFPMGIQIVRELHETLVPWGWGVNGAFSVFASVLAFVLALNAGFQIAMIAGVACYAVALLIVLSFRGRGRGSFATTA